MIYIIRNPILWLGISTYGGGVLSVYFSIDDVQEIQLAFYSSTIFEIVLFNIILVLNPTNLMSLVSFDFPFVRLFTSEFLLIANNDTHYLRLKHKT
jgi:hypothetical protein